MRAAFLCFVKKFFLILNRHVLVMGKKMNKYNFTEFIKGRWDDGMQCLCGMGWARMIKGFLPIFNILYGCC